MRIDEEFSKFCFDNYMTNELNLSLKSWKEGENPPDYYFNLDSQCYAVEVGNDPQF